MNIEQQDGGFVFDTVISLVKEGLKIRSLYKKFKAIGMSVQEIVRDSYKPNGLYDIVTVISTLNTFDDSKKKKMEEIIQKYNLKYFKDLNLKFVYSARDLKVEIEKLRDIVNEVAKNIGGKAVANELASTIKDSSDMTLESTDLMVEDLKKDVKKKGFFSKLKRSKDKNKSRNDKYSETYDTMMDNYDSKSKIYKAARTAKMAIKINDLIRNLEDALKQFNMASQQFQIEFLYHSYNNKDDNNNSELIDFGLSLSKVIKQCPKDDIKGISECINIYLNNKKKSINNQKHKTLNDEIKIVVKYFPEVVDEKYKRQVEVVDYQLLTSTIDSIGGGLELIKNNNYKYKYSKYKKKYEELNIIYNNF